MNKRIQNRKKKKFADLQVKRTTYYRFGDIFPQTWNPVSGIIFLFVFLMFWGSASAEQYLETATNTVATPRTVKEQIHPVLYPIKFFSKYISPIDGNRCPMYPSCSEYCLEAAQKHGLFMGWIMSCDRLIRCGRDELKLSPTVKVNDAKLSYDPVVSNDFWW